MRSDKKLVGLIVAVLLISVFALASTANANFVEDGWYFKKGYFNYAPSGMPDFDQKQDQWQRIWCGPNGTIDTLPAGDDLIVGSFIVPGPNCTLDSTPISDDVLQWCFCGPTAVANCLWWFDSKYANASGEPGDGLDEFPLVQAYNSDDHGAENVPWLITDLASRMSTCMNGTTNVVDMEKAIDAWLDETGLNDTLYEHTSVQYPDFSWIESEIERSQDVILLLGFYENYSCYWERVGGHYVTCAGVNSSARRIALSDPFFDHNASGNGPGRMVPDPHPASYSATFHNDAQNLSHDYYNVTLVPNPSGPSPVWTLSNYPVSLNPPLVINFTEIQYTGGPVHTVIEYAVVISPVPKPALEVDKTVWNGTAWVKALTAKINDTLQFRSTITNTGDVNLTQIRFWDILDCSLKYQGRSLKIDNESTRFCDPWMFRFKPRVLHPDPCWSPIGNPINSILMELCPPCGKQRQIVDWDDTNHDGNVSVCDQIELVEPFGVYYEGLGGDLVVIVDSGVWYHVDRVPYTLNLSNATYGTKYFDSVLNWDDPDMNLSDPVNSTWLEVCCCKDRYIILNWTDLGCPPGLGINDKVFLRNERTQEVVEYTVEEVAIDLVVSIEYEMGNLDSSVLIGPLSIYPVSFILEPNQTITIEYNATVVKCGVDNNTFVAKGKYCPMDDGDLVAQTLSYSNENIVTRVIDGAWYYSDPAVVTITVPCPSGDAADKTPVIKEVFTVGEPVYALGRDFAPNKSVDIYITPVRTWAFGDTISDYARVGPVPVVTDANGSIGINPKVLMWPDPIPGKWHMVFDDPNDTFDPGIDVIDDFSVIGAAVPVVTPPGLVVLIGLLSIIAISTLIRRKRR